MKDNRHTSKITYMDRRVLGTAYDVPDRRRAAFLAPWNPKKNRLLNRVVQESYGKKIWK